MHQEEDREFYQQLGAFLRKMREKQGLSQSDVADFMGVTFQQVQKYEKGINRLTVYALMEYANALEVHPSVFLDGDFTNVHCCVLNTRLIKNNLNTIYKSLDNIMIELAKRQ